MIYQVRTHINAHLRLLKAFPRKNKPEVAEVHLRVRSEHLEPSEKLHGKLSHRPAKRIPGGSLSNSFFSSNLLQAAPPADPAVRPMQQLVLERPLTNLVCIRIRGSFSMRYGTNQNFAIGMAVTWSWQSDHSKNSQQTRPQRLSSLLAPRSRAEVTSWTQDQAPRTSALRRRRTFPRLCALTATRM